MLTTVFSEAAVVKKDVRAADVKLDINTAINCGLILQELISNSLQHAFEPGEEGKIEIEFSRNQIEDGNDNYVLQVCDTGSRSLEDWESAAEDSFGLELVQILTEENLQGNLEIINSEKSCFRITFPAGDKQ
jgi:two-component sensor histidine kinase